MKKVFLIGLTVAASPFASGADQPACAQVNSLSEAVSCVQINEPAFKNATEGKKEADELESSAYRLINPDFGLDYVTGSSLGDAQREVTFSLMFTFELGGKRSARAQVFRSEGLTLQADAFEQRIAALTELGGAVLRLSQLKTEKAVLDESLSTFRGIIRLYGSRGQLAPEQRVSLNAFELITLDYEKQILDNEAETIRVQVRTKRLFGEYSKGQALNIDKFKIDIKRAFQSIDQWVEGTPEMLRLRSEQTKAEGEFAVARAEMWPDLKIGPAIRQVTVGPYNYNMTGISVSFPIPLLTWNSALRTSRATTEKRVQSKVRWETQDVRSQYMAKLTQLEKIEKLLREAKSEAEIQRKHHVTESYFQRGLVSGALVIEAHRSLVDYYLTKHGLERQFLENSLTFQALLAEGELK